MLHAEVVELGVLQSLLDICRRIDGTVPKQEESSAWQQVADEVRRFFDCEQFSLYTLDREQSARLQLHVRSLDNPRGIQFFGGTQPSHLLLDASGREGITSRAATTLQEFVLGKMEIASGSVFIQPELSTLSSGAAYSMLVLPMLNRKNRLIGVLRLDNKEHSRSQLQAQFTDTDLVLSKILGTHLAHQLEQSREAERESILESIPLVMWRKDLKGRYLWANQRFCLSINREDVVGSTDSAFFSPDLCKRYADGDRIAAEKGHFEDSHEPYQTAKDRSLHFIHVIKTAIKNDDGIVIGTQGLFVDVTTSKYRQLLDQAPIGFVELDAEGNIIHKSDPTLALLGYDSNGFTGKFQNFIAASDKKLFDRLMVALLAKTASPDQQKDNIPINLKKCDGELLPVLLTARSIGSGTGLKLLCVINEIRVGIGIEETLREPNEEYLRQIRILDLPVFCLGKDLKTTFCNREYERREGRRPFGKKSSEIYPSELGIQYDKDNEQVITEGIVLDKVEMHPASDGKEFAVRVLKFPIKDSDAVTGLQCVYWNYENNDRALSLLRKAYLASIVNKTKRERESFLAMLAHQLRSPIWQAFERANRRVEEMDPHAELLQKGQAGFDLRRMAQVRGLTRKARSVAWNIDMFSRISEVGDVPIRQATMIYPRILAKLAREAAIDQQSIRRVSGSFAERTGSNLVVPDFSISIFEPAWPPRGRIDGELALIEQAVGNLIDNAFKYSLSNSIIEIELGLSQEEAVLLVKNKPPRDLWIDDEVIANCRKREWRSKGAIDSDADGTGLGLWLVDRIMAAHQGELIIKKTDEHGWSQFELKFKIK
jgi:PAS domain S-box-containing protein